MARRIILGANSAVSDSGVFISKPGRDVLDTTTNYLLDSRFRTLSRHVNGRVSASKQGNGLFEVWTAEVTFPDLGYVPIFQASFVFSGGSAEGIPNNASIIPTNAARQIIAPSGGLPVSNAGAWIVGTNVLRAGMRSAGNNIFSTNFDLVYIIFKNRFGE